jgi:hypothetical protein
LSTKITTIQYLQLLQTQCLQKKILFTQLTGSAKIYWAELLTSEILIIMFTQLYTTIIEHQSEIITPKTKIIGFMGLLMKIWDIWGTFKKVGFVGRV